MPRRRPAAAAGSDPGRGASVRVAGRVGRSGYGLCVPARCNSLPSGSARLPERQRVAVEIVADAASGRRLATGWLRHGETADAALARILTGCGPGPDHAAAAATSMELTGSTSQVHELRSAAGPAVRLHLLGLQFSLPDNRFAGQLLDTGLPGTGLPDVREVLVTIDTEHPRHRSPHAGHPPADDPIRIQRAAGYAIVRDRGRVLLTRMRWSGRWALPGGGIDFGEHPDHAVAREVSEESGFRLSVVRLLGMSTALWIGRAPDGVLENFHAVNLLYTGVAPPGIAPQVLEVDGSTEAVEWVEESGLAALPLTSAAVSGLALAGVGRR